VVTSCWFESGQGHQISDWNGSNFFDRLSSQYKTQRLRSPPSATRTEITTVGYRTDRSRATWPVKIQHSLISCPASSRTKGQPLGESASTRAYRQSGRAALIGDHANGQVERPERASASALSGGLHVTAGPSPSSTNLARNGRYATLFHLPR
jgi:hypothetical protein